MAQEAPKRISSRYSGTEMNGYGISYRDIACPEGTLGWHIGKFVSETPEKVVRAVISAVAGGARKLINTNSRLRKS